MSTDNIKNMSENRRLEKTVVLGGVYGSQS